LLADDAATQAQRTRALDFLKTTLRNAHAQWTRLVEKQPMDPEAFDVLVRLVDWLSIRFLGDMAGLSSSEHRPSPTLERYERIRVLIDELVPMATPQVVHHLLDVFTHFVSVAPIAVLMQMGQLLHSSRQLTYHHDHLITDQVVKLVRLYLADHGPVLRSTEAAMPVLIDILDILVEEGHVEGILLGLELGELYR